MIFFANKKLYIFSSNNFTHYWLRFDVTDGAKL